MMPPKKKPITDMAAYLKSKGIPMGPSQKAVSKSAKKPRPVKRPATECPVCGASGTTQKKHKGSVIRRNGKVKRVCSSRMGCGEEYWADR